MNGCTNTAMNNCTKMAVNCTIELGLVLLVNEVLAFYCKHMYHTTVLTSHVSLSFSPNGRSCFSLSCPFTSRAKFIFPHIGNPSSLDLKLFIVNKSRQNYCSTVILSSNVGVWFYFFIDYSFRIHSSSDILLHPYFIFLFS